MGQFRTEIKLENTPFIDHSMHLMTTGSCFADNLGDRLVAAKFKTSVNPFGVSYNPLSIHKALALAATSHKPDIKLNVKSQGTWRNYDFHSEWSSLDELQLNSMITNQLQTSGSDLKQTRVLMITYGTAWIYEHIKLKSVVSNCHKVAAKEFQKRLLAVSEIVDSFSVLSKLISTINPDIRYILTLSPVRHIRDGLEMNQVSKSILRQAIHEIVSSNPSAEYFPAYEMMMDDLRDYRFYDADMIHPSETAQDYIWEKFRDKYVKPITNELIDKFMLLKKALDHKPFHADSAEHQSFLEKTLDKLSELKGHLNVTEEISHLKEKLRSDAKSSH